MSVTTDPEEIVTDVSALISLPDVVLRLNSLVEDEHSTVTDIGNLFAQDPSLTAQILKIANSPRDRNQSSIDSVTRATTLLGANRIRDMALSACMSDAMAGIPNPLVSNDTFWYHSLNCAVISKSLANNCLPAQADALFTCGLLHDIGQLVLFHKLPELAFQALAYLAADSDDPDVAAAERRLIGVDHTQVGAALARNWSLPAIIAAVLEHHHNPTHATVHEQAVAIVHIANSLAVLAELESTDLFEAPAIDSAAWDLTGLDAEIVEPTILEAREQFAAARLVFMN